MTPTSHPRPLLAGNLLVDVFLDAGNFPPPAEHNPSVHRTSQEVESVLTSVGQDLWTGGAPGATVRDGGAPANVARILRRLGHECTLAGVLGDDHLADHYRALADSPSTRFTIAAGATTGVSVTWYRPYHPDSGRLIVSPPPPLPQAFRQHLVDDIASHTLVYLDGYALPSFLADDPPTLAPKLAATGASIFIDLAHPAVVGAHAPALASFLAALAAGPANLTIFASTEELRPMGGIAALNTAVGRGTLTLVQKEPPKGSTIYRLGRPHPQRVAQHYGATAQPIETTGLGDAFIAGWLAAILDGAPSAHEFAARAHETALLCARQVGGDVIPHEVADTHS